MRIRTTHLPNSSSESVSSSIAPRIGPASTPTYSSPPKLFPATPPSTSTAGHQRALHTRTSSLEDAPGTQGSVHAKVDPDSPGHAKYPHRARGSRTNVGMLVWGYTLFLGSCTVLAVGLWAILIAPFVDTSQYAVLDAIGKDKHYKYLLLFLIFVHLSSTILSWWGLKIFRHA